MQHSKDMHCISYISCLQLAAEYGVSEVKSPLMDDMYRLLKVTK